MAERFVCLIRVLQSKVCILLQELPTNTSLRKHTEDSFVIFIYLFMVDDLFLSTYSHKNIYGKRMQKLCQLRGI
jgi:hypothetical protein